MSFALTTEQVRAQTKTVTRRLGWGFLTPGTEIQAVVKGMGLRKGERVEPIARLRIVEVRAEPLSRLLDDLAYGFDEITREGFAGHPVYGWPSTFVEMFCATHRGCTPETQVTRIAFEYLAPAASSTSDNPEVGAPAGVLETNFSKQRNPVGRAEPSGARASRVGAE